MSTHVIILICFLCFIVGALASIIFSAFYNRKEERIENKRLEATVADLRVRVEEERGLRNAKEVEVRMLRERYENED